MASASPSSSSGIVRLSVASASRGELEAHLRRCADDFVPALGARVDLADYAGKLSRRAVTFEAWSGRRLVGLVAAYLNDPDGREGFVTSVSVDESWRGQGIARELLDRLREHAASLGLARLRLETAKGDARAEALYRGLGFEAEDAGERLAMVLPLAAGAGHD